jgi:hypothetical protein
MANTGLFLIFLLFVISLFPTIFQNKVWGYGPPFAMLFITALFTLFELRDNTYRLALKSYAQDNRVPVVILLLYLVTTSISACIIGSFSNSAYAVGSAITIGALILFISAQVREEESYIFLIKLLFLIAAVNSVIALMLLLLKWSLGISLGIFPIDLFGDRKLVILQALNVPYVLKGLFWQPNALGILLAFAFPAGLFLAHEAKDLRSKALYIAGLSLFMITMACAFAFISFVPVFVVLALFPIIRNQWVFNLVRVFIMAIVLAVDAIVLTGSDLTFLKSLPITSPIRVDLWNTAIAVIHNHLFFGVGASYTSHYLPLQLSAHNTFLEIGLGNGIFSLGLYSLFLLTLTWRIRLSVRAHLSAYMLLTFLTFFILQMFETLVLGGLSIGNFYFLAMTLAYLSLSVRKTVKGGELQNITKKG